MVWVCVHAKVFFSLVVLLTYWWSCQGGGGKCPWAAGHVASLGLPEAV